MKHTTATIFLVLALAVSGCVNLKPKPDLTRLYMLGAQVAPVASVEGKPEVYIGRIELPGFLEGSRIFHRSASGTLKSVPGARWAEAPSDALPRAIAMHLQGTGAVNVRAYYPWLRTDQDWATVSVQFERFSANAAGVVEVIAQWQVTTSDGEKRVGRYSAPELVWGRGDAADYVAKLDAALAGLAGAIAERF